MAKKTKYNARGATVEGIKFDSKLESECYIHFRHWCNKLNLKLTLQPTFELIPIQRPFPGKTLRAHTYTADFQINGGTDINFVIDVKSEATAKKRDFAINEKLLLHTTGILVTRILSPGEAAELMQRLAHG